MLVRPDFAVHTLSSAAGIGSCQLVESDAERARGGRGAYCGPLEADRNPLGRDVATSNTLRICEVDSRTGEMQIGKLSGGPTGDFHL
jgi:hypothetical protein